MENNGNIKRNYELNDPKIINGWAMFDWANSAYALVITTAIYPIYYLAVTADHISFLGINFKNEDLYAYALSAAYILIAFISPVLSGIADFGGMKKFFMRVFTTIGSLACISLFWFEGDNIFLGIGGLMLATIGFAGSIVFYNAYLPEIVTKDRYDTVSAKGFSWGYIGSVLLLVTNLIIITFHESLGITQGFATRLAFLMVGLWWLGFSQITFKRLPDINAKSNVSIGEMIKNGFGEIIKVTGEIKNQYNTKGFLLAFFCYSMGVQTIILLASTFASEELKFESSELIQIILILQLVGIAGAYFFAKLSDWRGNKLSLLVVLTIWICVCVMAYFVTEKWQFYIVAGLVGSVMGGVQSLSRATYSKLFPEGTTDNTSYFSFYDILEKLSIALGTFTFAAISAMTGSMRNSIIALALFFVLGFIFLTFIKIQPAEKTTS